MPTDGQDEDYRRAAREAQKNFAFQIDREERLRLHERHIAEMRSDRTAVRAALGELVGKAAEYASMDELEAAYLAVAGNKRTWERYRFLEACRKVRRASQK